MLKEIELLRVDEALQLPKFKASLDRLLNKISFDLILSCQSVATEDLPQFIEKATGEGNAVLIEREHNGYMVTLWKD